MIKFRKANIEDAELLFNWVNDPEVRRNSFNPQKIDWESHLAWFNGKIKSLNTHIFIFETENIPVGQVRFDKSDSCFFIDYSLDNSFRGRGYAKQMMEEAILALSNEVEENLEVVAEVKESNVASRKVFESLGGFNKSFASDDDRLIMYKKRI